MNDFTRHSGDDLFRKLMVACATSYVAFICII